MNVETLRPNFSGEIITPASAEYDATRTIWNAMIDRKPAAIARCTSPADVVAAVRFAAEQNVFPAIRGGGHNVAGLAMVDDGFVIDLQPMKAITVDVEARTATAQTGLTWGEFDAETQRHGLATTGGVISATGISGLTLGGGIGWLMGRYGLTCDNTLAYEVVLANGDLVRASAEEHPDLFWALKGGGGNFGVVTSITYRLHPVTTVLSGMLLHPIASAHEAVRFYRDFLAAGVPDELVVYLAALTTPDGVPVIAFVPTYCGDDLDEGERILEPIRKFGPPIADLVGRMPYIALQQMLDGAAPFGLRSYWKSTFLRALSDDAIDTWIQFAETRPSPRSFTILEPSHGAVSRVAADATAVSLRGYPFDLVILSLWEDAVDDASNTEWTRRFFSAMQPWAADIVYVNGLDHDDAARIPDAYGRNFARLCEVKTKYDPGNRFRRNQNIQPIGQAAGQQGA